MTFLNQYDRTMKKYVLGLLFIALLGSDLGAQGFAFGANGGLSIGFQ